MNQSIDPLTEMRVRVPVVVVVVLVLAGAVAPAVSGVEAVTGVGDHWDGSDGSTALEDAEEPPDDNETVDASVGAQLSATISATEEETREGVDAAAFEHAFRTRESERAQTVATRADRIRQRAVSARADYDQVRRAYRNDSITRSGFARRLAVLHARAERLTAAARRVSDRAGEVPDGELAAAGYDEAAMVAAVERLEPLRGTAAARLLEQFTGQAGTETRVALDESGGVSLTAVGEGARSRSVERDADPDTNLTVGRTEALESARGALTDPGSGRWALMNYTVDRDDGVYAFAFRLSSGTATGTAVVTVDGSSGEAVRIREETGEAPGESSCARFVAAVRADMRAELATVEDPDERAEIREEYRNRIETAREQCSGDDGDEPTVGRDDALSNAREELDAPERGRWTLEDELLVERSEGDVYAFTFRLDARDGIGVARVVVNAETGEATVLEERTSFGDRETEVPRLSESDAVSTARGALSRPLEGRWAVTDVREDEDAYTVAFELDAPGASGRATVVVNATTGAVESVDETVEEDGDDGDEPRISRDRAVAVAEGALSDPSDGNWTLAGVSEDERTYAVTFDLESDVAGGQATVTVNATTGAVESVDETVEELIGESTAISIARDALSEHDGGTWEWHGTSFDDEADTYTVTFGLYGDLEGTGTVVVDAVTGEVLSVDEDV